MLDIEALKIPLFTDYMGTIEMLYQIDDNFKTLCNDYMSSKQNAEKFRIKTFEDKKKELEYKLLAHELEKEILEYLEKTTP